MKEIDVDKYVKLLAQNDMKDKDRVLEIKEMIVRESNSISNKELHFMIENFLKHLKERKFYQFFLTFNYLSRGANRTFNLVFKNLFDCSKDVKGLCFIYKECVSQIPQQITFYRKKQHKIYMNDVLEEINNLIELAYELRKSNAVFETYTILELVSELITIVEKFPVKANTIKYFSMLFNIFISRGLLFSAANVLYRLLGVEKRTNLTREYVEQLILLMNIKDTEDEYHKMFCGLVTINAQQFQSELNNFIFDQDVDFNLNNSSLENFEFLHEYKGKTYKMKDDMRNYISFMRLNNFEYFIEDGILFFNGQYAKKSNSAKVFEIVNQLKEKSSFVDSRKIEEQRIKRNLEREKSIKQELETSQIDVTEKEKPKEIQKESAPREDFFTRRFNYFRIYQMLLDKIDSNENFNSRQGKIDNEFEEQMSKRNQIIEKFNQRKNEIDKILQEREEKTKKESFQAVRIPVPTGASSWRTAPKETSNVFQQRSFSPIRSGDEKFYVPPSKSHVYEFKDRNTSDYSPPPFSRNESINQSNIAEKKDSSLYDPSASFGTFKLNDSAFADKMKQDNQRNSSFYQRERSPKIFSPSKSFQDYDGFKQKKDYFVKQEENIEDKHSNVYIPPSSFSSMSSFGSYHTKSYQSSNLSKEYSHKKHSNFYYSPKIRNYENMTKIQKNQEKEDKQHEDTQSSETVWNSGHKKEIYVPKFLREKDISSHEKINHNFNTNPFGNAKISDSRHNVAENTKKGFFKK